MSTQSQNKTGTDASLLLSSLVENQTFSDKEAIVSIDPTKYDSESAGTFLLTSALKSQLGDADLLSYVQEEPTPRRLDSAFVVKAYLSIIDDEEKRKKIKDLMRTVNPKELVKALSVELAGTLSENEQTRLNDFIKSLETSKQVDCKRFGDYECTKLEGKLGKGTSLSVSGRYLEQRILENGGVIRIFSTNEGYRAIMQFDDLDLKKNGYGKFKTLTSIVNHVFGKDFKVNLESYMESTDSDFYFLGYDQGRYNQLSLKNQVGLRANFKDYYFEKNRYFGGSLDAASAAIGAVGAMGVILGASFGAPLAYVPSAIVLGSCTGHWITASRDDEKLGILKRMYLNPQRKKFKTDVLQTMKLFNEVTDSLETITDEKNAEVNFEQFKKKSENSSKSFNLLKDNFGKLSACKGYVIEFDEASLDSVYKKASQIVEILGAYSKNPDIDKDVEK